MQSSIAILSPNPLAVREASGRTPRHAGEQVALSEDAAEVERMLAEPSDATCLRRAEVIEETLEGTCWT